MPLWARWTLTIAILLFALASAWHIKWAMWGTRQRRAHRRRMRHTPIRSSKRDAKRAARAFVEDQLGRERGSVGWKKARKQMARWEREGRKHREAKVQ